MMLLKVSILCFKPFKSMSSVENQLPPRGTELFACSVSSFRVLWFMEQQLNVLLGGFEEIQAGLRPGTFQPKSREKGLGVIRVCSGMVSDFWHRKPRSSRCRGAPAAPTSQASQITLPMTFTFRAPPGRVSTQSPSLLLSPQVPA